MAKVSPITTNPAAAEAIRRKVVATEMRSEVPANALGWLIIVGTLVALRHLFLDIADPLLLNLWLVGMGVILTGWLIALGIFVLRPPSDEDIHRFWVPFGRGLMAAVDVGVATGLWVLLPNASDELKLFNVPLFAWFITLQLFASTEATQINGFAVVFLIGSYVAFIATHAMPYGPATAIFLVLFGATILAVRRFVRNAAVAAIEARAVAEQAQASLERALTTVAAERDAKTRFIASASHDLQQPIQAASLFFEHALSSEDPAVRDRARSGARSAFGSVQALIGLMLEHLRLEAGAVRARPRPVALGPLLATLALEHGAGGGMAIRAVPSGLAVMADPDLLKRAAGNLLANALKHSAGRRVLLGARRRDDQVELWVIDDGAGVAPADRARLFEDYAQGDHGTDNRGGFGIGLSSARRIVELMHGTLELEPRWTQGAAFRIRLPATTIEDQGLACEAA